MKRFNNSSEIACFYSPLGKWKIKSVANFTLTHYWNKDGIYETADQWFHIQPTSKPCYWLQLKCMFLESVNFLLKFC